MQFKTVRDVVEHSRRLHQQIRDYYHQLSEENCQARVSMLLQYLQRHEDHLAQTLGKFEQDKSQKVLASWFQYAPDQDISEVLAGIDVSENMSTEDVVEMALKLDDYFIELYQHMVSSSTSAPVKEVFQNLLDMEQHEKIQLAKTALQIHDM
ncbi:MAG: hypothetical protein RPR98_10130 [Bermanella sp.]|jgi:hypothetical protein